MFFSVYTLGCKLNQLETEAITDSFCAEGFSLVPWGSAKAVLLLINTCTVTSMADQKARRLIRKALRENPLACLIVTGCYAQMEEAALAALEAEGSTGEKISARARRLFVVSGEKKDRILDLPRFIGEAEASGFGTYSENGDLSNPLLSFSTLADLIEAWFSSPVFSPEKGDGSFRFRPVNFASHSRSFIKIQDGCDRSCAYCRVSIARGKSRSMGADEALALLRSLEERGFTEAVLTGVNITQYRDSEKGLPALLELLLKGTEKIRLRLSSIEPDGLSAGLIRVLENDRIRPHFHLSVQSGSAEILGKMGRTYTPDDIKKASAMLRSIKKDPFLAADIIAGFPGETDNEFEKTLELCDAVGFAWIHAFPFSPRPGTAAFNFSGQVNQKDSVKRVEVLSTMAAKGRREYLSRWEGKVVEAVVETAKVLPEGMTPVLSENYLRLLVLREDGKVPASGELIKCRIMRDDILPKASFFEEAVPELFLKQFDAAAEFVL